MEKKAFISSSNKSNVMFMVLWKLYENIYKSGLDKLFMLKRILVLLCKSERLMNSLKIKCCKNIIKCNKRFIINYWILKSDITAIDGFHVISNSSGSKFKYNQIIAQASKNSQNNTYQWK